jgi:hypothetical protein
LRPVPADYEPAYPKHLTADEIRDLLRPGLFRRFSPATMLAGALVAGALAGCERAAPQNAAAQSASDAAPPLPADQTTRANPQLRARVEQIAAEVLGPYRERATWNERASIGSQTMLPSNPPVKYPRIPISYGNSYVGIFDTVAAKEATLRMFKAYGLELQRDVPLKGDGYEFVADGYDPAARTGFKLIVPALRTRPLDGQTLRTATAKGLEPEELPALDQAVGRGDLRILVVDATQFPDMDADRLTPMQYYLASVVDYLNWVHGDRQIEPGRLMGRVPGATDSRRWHPMLDLVPGGDFETDRDLSRWSVRNGRAALSRDWTSSGVQSLLLELDAGGEAVYAPPEPIEVGANPSVLMCDLRVEDPTVETLTVTFTLVGPAGETFAVPGRMYRSSFAFSPSRKPPFDRAVAVKVTADKPVRLFIDHIAVGRGKPSSGD